VRHDDAAARQHRAYRRDALAVDVVQRQRRQHPVAFGQLLCRHHRPGGVEHVPVREKHASRCPGGAGGVHEHRRRLGRDCGQRRVWVPGELKAVWIGRADDGHALCALQQRAQTSDVLRRRKYQARARMRQREFELRVAAEQIDRRDDVPRVHRAQEHACRGDAVGQHERDHRARRDACVRKIGAERGAAAPQLSVGEDRRGLRRDDARRRRAYRRVRVDYLPERAHRRARL